MKLRSIGRAETDAALQLLSEGFPALPARVWRDSLDTMFSYAERRGDGTVGQIGHAGGEDVGICLALPAERLIYAETPCRDMNVSAFYLRPGKQWMTTLFLRRLMADASFDYLDLTPSYSMREINRRLGFVDHSAGMVVVPTVLSCWRLTRQMQLLTLQQLPENALDAGHRRILEDHRDLGCHVVVAAEEGAFHPLILAPTRRKGLPGARVILARDRALVRRALGPLCRHLLRVGAVYLEYDAPVRENLPEALFWRRAAPVQVTRPLPGEAIDLTYCELVFIRT